MIPSFLPCHVRNPYLDYISKQGYEMGAVAGVGFEPTIFRL